MSAKITQTRRFARQYKKLHNNIVIEVNKAVDVICLDPHIGALKKGGLAHLRVYKFNAVNQLYLLGYSLNEAQEPLLICLEAIGIHENFYRDIK